MVNKFKPLIIKDVEIKIPIIQGGMGVKVSTASLAAAVANCGGAGTIASVGLGYGNPEIETDYLKVSREALRDEIRKAKALTSGVVGVNIMVALTNYEDLVRISAEEGADFIVSGAGLPMKLPGFVKGTSIKLIPIVSSAKAAGIILKTWNRRYERFPDAFVVEGPLAGGHLGFKPEDLKPPKANSLEGLVVDVIKLVKEYEEKFKITIPVIAAGGIFDGADVARFFKLGVQGVQMATRFVATKECSVADKFKELYIKAKDEDLVIIDSPVGLPGRAIKTAFIEKMMRGEKTPIRCLYKCLITCDPTKVPYCIAKALCNASTGDLDNAVVFSGKNVSRIDRIVSVKELMDSIASEAVKELEK
ncbi:MAG: nitronate monooxygenase family protein [Candidatus Omnitrophica bacterium]|nr:nitronate monooxygenase family protein [Candidatus Omnitrophota bacterium]MDD5429329.1 nitronate monooxygenase family protein [Candidatus Omnitrophota bacterium]